MGIALFYYVAFLVFGFVAMYAAFAPQVKIFEKSGKFSFFMQPILYIFLLYALGSIGAYYLVGTDDFIGKLSLWRILAPLFCAVLIYALTLLFGKKAKIFTVVLCVSICVFLQPLETKFVPFGFNEYVFKTLAVMFFSIFCLFYGVLNVLPHTIVIVTTSMLLGVSLLSGVGGAPVYLAMVSAVMIGSLLAYLWVNLQRVKIEFDNLSCTITAFLLCNIFIPDMAELSFNSCVIFTVVFWAELAVAAYNKFFVNKSGSLLINSHFYAAAQKLTLAALMSNIFKVGLVVMFFGWFQLFSVNQYSLPIVAFFVVLWLNTSMGANLLQAPKSLKQLNSEFIDDIKKNIKDTKETISQITDKKD